MTGKIVIILHLLIHLLVMGRAYHELGEDACRTICGISYPPPEDDDWSPETELIEEQYPMSEVIMDPEPEPEPELIMEPDDSPQLVIDPEEDVPNMHQIRGQSRWSILRRIHVPPRGPRLHRIPRPREGPFRMFSHKNSGADRGQFRPFSNSNPRADRIRPFSHRIPIYGEGPFRDFSRPIPGVDGGSSIQFSNSNLRGNRRAFSHKIPTPREGPSVPFSNSNPGAVRKPFRQTSYSVPGTDRRQFSYKIPRQREGSFRTFSHPIPESNRGPFTAFSISNPEADRRSFRQSPYSIQGTGGRPISHSIPGANTRPIAGHSRWPSSQPGPPNRPLFLPSPVPNAGPPSGQFSNSIPASVNKPFLRPMSELDATRLRLSGLIRGDRFQPEMTFPLPVPIARPPPEVIIPFPIYIPLPQPVTKRPNVPRQLKFIPNPNYVPRQKLITRRIGRTKSKTIPKRSLQTPKRPQLPVFFRKSNVIPNDKVNRLNAIKNKAINQKYERWTLYANE